VDPGPLRDALTVALGVATGVLSAMFGVGGAVVSTPGIRALGASALIAVGTTLPSIFPGALSGTARYVREGIIDWHIALPAAAVGVPAAVGGSVLSEVVPGDGHWLMLLTAALLATTAWRLRKPPPERASRDLEPCDVSNRDLLEREADDRRRESWVAAGVGVVAGGMSGLLGVGGGIVMVPAFSELLGMSIRRAVATSLVCVGVFAIPGTITHALLGNIDWRFAIGLAVGVVPGARIGAAIALRVTEARHRLVVAGFLGVIAMVYAVGEVIALAR
jgi:uncharacterized protein